MLLLTSLNHNVGDVDNDLVWSTTVDKKIGQAFASVLHMPNGEMKLTLGGVRSYNGTPVAPKCSKQMGRHVIEYFTYSGRRRKSHLYPIMTSYLNPWAQNMQIC